MMILWASWSHSLAILRIVGKGQGARRAVIGLVSLLSHVARDRGAGRSENKDHKD